MERTCSIEGCGARYLARGLCKKHYYAKRYADVQAGVIPVASCEVDGCPRPRWAKGLCASHYNAKRDSDRRAVVRRQSRPCVVCGADLTGRPPNAKYCTVRCKEQAQHEKRRGTAEYKARQHDHYVRNASEQRRRFLGWAYGISREDYDALVEAQHGLCAICGVDRPGGRGEWHVDHDHATRRVRGLLCANCNLMLGNGKDDPARLRAAAAYLEARAAS